MFKRGRYPPQKMQSSHLNWFVEITSLLFDLNYKFELIGASLLALAKSIYYFSRATLNETFTAKYRGDKWSIKIF